MAPKTTDDGGRGLSRRGFLKGVGAGAVATSILKETTESLKAAAAAPKTTIGPGKVPVSLTINGTAKSVEVEPRVTLLDVLRDRLDMTGSKKVCDRATCGACTVLLDDEPVYACTLLAVEAEGHQITTIEGLGSPEKLSDIQQAYVEHDGLQCGFCTPGFVVSTTAFLRDNPDATLEDVRDGLGGNLCRCGSYVGVTKAALETAKGLGGGS